MVLLVISAQKVDPRRSHASVVCKKVLARDHQLVCPRDVASESRLEQTLPLARYVRTHRVAVRYQQRRRTERGQARGSVHTEALERRCVEESAGCDVVCDCRQVARLRCTPAE